MNRVVDVVIPGSHLVGILFRDVLCLHTTVTVIAHRAFLTTARRTRGGCISRTSIPRRRSGVLLEALNLVAAIVDPNAGRIDAVAVHYFSLPLPAHRVAVD